MRFAVVLPILVVLVSGCATKDWVREVLGKESAQVDQRVGAVEQRLSGEATRVEGLDTRLQAETQRVGRVEGRLEEEARRVEGMGSQLKQVETTAATAKDRAEAVETRVIQLWTKRHARDLVEAVDVHFGFDRADLNDAAQTALHGLIKELRDNPKLTVDLEGYTDPKGPRDYNYQLSQRRVEAVRRYLASQGVQLPRIYSVGMGPVEDRAIPDDRKRRVTVKLMLYPE